MGSGSLPCGALSRLLWTWTAARSGSRGPAGPRGVCSGRRRRPRRPAAPCSLRPIILRRARSLPSLPERRQRARAPGCCVPTWLQPRATACASADALGLELAQVKVFNAGEDPSVPLHVLSRLAINSDLCCSSQDLEFTRRAWCPTPPPPVEAPDHERLGRPARVPGALSPARTWASAHVRVRNVAFEKQVAVRYTFGLRSAHEVQAAVRGPAGSGRGRLRSSASRCRPSCWSWAPRALRAAPPCGRSRALGQQRRPRDYSLTAANHALHMPRECEESWIHFI